MKLVLSSMVALGDPVSATACAVLAGFADDDSEASILQRAGDESDVHANLCRDGGMRWVHLFESFPSLRERVPLEIFLMLLPTPVPKLYPIASSPSLSSEEVQLVVPRRFIWDSKNRRKGLASDDLSILPP